MAHGYRQQVSRWCDYCGQMRLAERQNLSPIHFFLALFTCGLWLLVAIPLAIIGSFRCQRCGSKV